MTRHLSPSAGRNLEPIVEALRPRLPAVGWALEVASGPGQHVAAFAATFPGITWQPSDIDPDALASIEAWRAEAGTANLLPALELDVSRSGWTAAVRAPLEAADPAAGAPALDVLLAINLLHVAPWETTVGLLEGAGQILAPGGRALIYGPFMLAGRHHAPSNAAFDQSLRRRDPRWGVRDVEEIARVAECSGLALLERLSLPANNHVLVLGREGRLAFDA